MNFATLRRHSWISLIIAIAASVGFTQPLLAQVEAPEQAAPAAPEGSAPDGQLQTLAVIAGAKYEKLLADITFLGPYLGQPAAGQMADAIVAQYTMGKSATALDKTKPWGVIVQTDGMQFPAVVVLPISNLDEAIEVAKGYGAEVKDADNNTKELSLANKPPVYLKADNGVVFVSNSQSSLLHLPPNPLEILGEMLGEYDLSVSLAVKNIPPMYRQFAIGAMQAGMQQNMTQQPGESEDDFADRQKLAEGQVQQITQLINEVDTVKVGLAIDSAEKRTFFDFTYQFVGGSKLAKQMAAYAQPNSDFAGFFQPDAAATAIVSTKADPELMADDLAQLESMMRGVRQKIAREIDKKHADADPADRDALKAAVNDIFDAVEATVKQGQIGGGASLHASPETMTFVAGAHVKEPAKIEEALKKLEAVGKKRPDFPGIKWNAAEHSGVKFHTLTVPVPEDKKEARRMFGDNLDVAVGLGPESVYVAVGKDNIAAVSKAIDASAADRSKTVPPFAGSVSLGQIITVAADAKEEGQEKATLQAIAEELNGSAKGQDHVSITGSVIPNGLRYRLEAQEGVLKAVGVAAKMKAQARRAAAN